MIKKKAVMTNCKKSAFTQLGGTMVSMVGVLLIMAVMVIGVIQVYQFFIRSAKVQNTAKMIMTLALERQNSAINEGTGGRIRVPGSYAALFIENGTEGKFAPYFWIDTTLADKAFCEGLKKSELIKANIIMVNDSANGTCPGKLAFYFKKNPYDSGRNLLLCDDDSVCGECGHCGANGICEGCAEGESCLFPFDAPEGEKMCCDPENLVDGMCCRFPDGEGGCNECAEDTDCTADPSKTHCNTNTGKCQECEEGEFKGGSKCYPCDYTSYVGSTSQMCSACPNREYRGTNCVIPQGACPEGYPLQDSYINDGSCYRCDSLGSIISHRVRGNNCLSSCGDLREIATFTGTGNSRQTTCALKTCPENAPIRMHSGACGECGKDLAYGITEDECYKCPNSVTLMDTLGRPVCRPCPSYPGHVYTSAGQRQCEHCGFQWNEANGSCTLPICQNGGTWNSQNRKCDCPSGYVGKTCDLTKVEYLESTGTQYINTGINYGGTSDVITLGIAPMQSTGDIVFMGTFYISGSYKGVEIGGYNGKYRGNIQGPGDIPEGAKYTVGSKDTLTYTKSGYWELNGLSIGDTKTAPLELPFYLFCRNYPSSQKFSSARIYNMDIVRNGEKILDFIPVLDPSGTPAMYDKVSGELFHNAGTGDFIAGPMVN